MVQIITPEMVKKLFEKANKDGVKFPVKLTLQVGGETIIGFMYEDGRFEQDTKTEGESEVGTEPETGNSSS